MDPQITALENFFYLARRWTNAAREFWEIVGLQKLNQSLFPIVSENEIIPFGNDVAQRTSGARLTKWNSAVHATRGLGSQIRADFWKIVDFIPIFQTFFCRSIHDLLPFVFYETSEEKSKFQTIIQVKKLQKDKVIPKGKKLRILTSIS